MSDAQLTAPDVAALANVHPQTIRRAADSGELPCYRTPGGHRRFVRADVFRWLEKVQRSPEKEDGQSPKNTDDLLDFAERIQRQNAGMTAREAMAEVRAKCSQELLDLAQKLAESNPGLSAPEAIKKARERYAEEFVQLAQEVEEKNPSMTGPEVIAKTRKRYRGLWEQFRPPR